MKLPTSMQLNRLKAGALSAIWYSHARTFGRSPMAQTSKSGVPPEEDFIAMLILEGLPRLDAVWQPLINRWGMQLNITGVFCHQTPQAEFKMGKKTESPELADLLLVRKHHWSGGSRQVAVLLQAKMSDDGDVSLKADDPQLYLLSSWPRFRVCGKKAPAEELVVGRAGRQGLYAAVSRKRHYPEENTEWPDGCAWTVMWPGQRAEAEKSLAALFVDLLSFRDGRDFYDPASTGCDWSKLIHYLLMVTFDMPLRTRDMDPKGKRGYGGTGYTSGGPPGGGGLSLVLPKSLRGKTSSLLPKERQNELSGKGNDYPPSNETKAFDEGGQGRVIIIETWEGEG